VNQDPYSVLGVSKAASQEDIQRAYRRLVKKLHPDLNPGNKAAESQFKDVSAAYDLLDDAQKRARYDRGEIDATGADRPQHRSRTYAHGPEGHYGNDTGFSDFPGFGDIFSHFFDQPPQANRATGEDAHYRLEVDFLDAINGCKRQVTLPDGAPLAVTIPPGIQHGQVLRLRGKGHIGPRGAAAGDALIEVRVRPHPLFRRDGDDIRLELPLPLHQAVLGGAVKVPTPSGSVNLVIPPWSTSGTVLRLRAKGVRRADGTRGDQLVTIKIMLPDERDEALERFMKQWRPQARAKQATGT